VTATVCSTWTPRDRSTDRIVQPSRSMTIFGLPARNQGSIAMTSPGRNVRPRPATPSFGTSWYGLPAYANEGKVICFFKAASKYKERYATFGFDQAANLEEGSMWPSAWFLTKLTAADEERIAALVKKAAG
jgi:hypothetical protein